MFLVDTEAGRLVPDREVKAKLAAQQPYSDWLHAVCSTCVPCRAGPDSPRPRVGVRRQLAFATPRKRSASCCADGDGRGEPIGSMGTDTPIAVLSQRPRLLYDYFVELFAQVTNPPLDAIREEIVTSLRRVMGPRAESARTHGRVVSADRAAVAGARQRRAGEDHRHQRTGTARFRATVLRALYRRTRAVREWRRPSRTSGRPRARRSRTASEPW